MIWSNNKGLVAKALKAKFKDSMWRGIEVRSTGNARDRLMAQLSPEEAELNAFVRKASSLCDRCNSMVDSLARLSTFACRKGECCVLIKLDTSLCIPAYPGLTQYSLPVR